MTTNPAPPVLDTPQKKYKGSLTGTLVRTLLIFTFIPLALMAGAAYFRARTLLRDQAITQSENLLSNQLKIVDGEIKKKEAKLDEQVALEEFSTLVEIALHANPQSSEFQKIRQNFITEIETNNNSATPLFDQFFLIDTDGIVRIASNANWQNLTLDASIFEDAEDAQSHALYGLSPLYENELILATAINYQTKRGSTLGTLVGITEKENLQILIQPLNGLAPFANTYFILSDNTFITSNANTGEFAQVTSSESKNELIASLSDLVASNDEKPTALDVTAPDGDPALAQLQWYPGMKSGIILEIKTDQIYGQVSSLAPFTLILVLVTLAGTGLALTLGIKRVIQPLRSLSEITRKFAEGDWKQRANVQSDDEVGLLANSFNYMANEIGDVYHSLEQKVEERTRQIQTAAEVAQSITTLSSLDEMLKKTTELLVQQFGYHQASIYIVDRSGKFVDFKAGFGDATKGLADKNYRLEVGSASIIGWVSANNRTRIALDVSEDSLHLKNELLPDTRSEASVPISLGDLVLGVLDVQSKLPNAFSKDTIVMLQTLASQTAAAIQTTGLIETSHVNFQELERLYRSSRLIAEAKDGTEILEISGQILKGVPYPAALFSIENNQFSLISSSDSIRSLNPTIELGQQYDVTFTEVNSFLFRGAIIVAATDMVSCPKILQDIITQLELTSAAFLPIKKHDDLIAIILIGSRGRTLTSTSIQLYINFADLMSISLEKSDAIQQTEKHLHEVEALASINDLISSAADLQSFFRVLLAKIQQIIGDYNMIVALYDEKSNTIGIPFSYENKQIISIDPFPLGEGLTSILIRTRQPLMIVENTEQRAVELGAKVTGKPARSWMGAPMLVHNTPIGALIIQDTENEHAFDENDLKFLQP
jgi:nitrate/nitrite-specific signal transduction histidine kinase